MTPEALLLHDHCERNYQFDLIAGRFFYYGIKIVRAARLLLNKRINKVHGSVVYGARQKCRKA